MNLDKKLLRMIWYEDSNGDYIPEPDKVDPYAVFEPENAMFYVSQFPNRLVTNHSRLRKKEDIDNCDHPKRFMTYTKDRNTVTRKCSKCGGYQTRIKFHFWGKEWSFNKFTHIFTGNRGWDQELVLAMANSGDFTLNEAILLAATSCERCMNVLAHKYGLDDGYEEYSEEWNKAGTHCRFCENEDKKVEEVIPESTSCSHCEIEKAKPIDNANKCISKSDEAGVPQTPNYIESPLHIKKKQNIFKRFINYMNYHFLTGHISIGRKLTIYGRNAMHWGVTYHTKKYGYICFRLPLPCFGKWLPLYLYLSPNATPWASTFMLGRKHSRENWALSRIRRERFGHNFDTDLYREELRKVNNNIPTFRASL